MSTTDRNSFLDAPTRMDSPKPVRPNQYGRRIGFGAAIHFGGVITQQIMRFLSNWLIAQMFGPAVLGIFNLALIFWSSIEMSFNGGLARAIQRHLPHYLVRDEHAEAKGTIRLAFYTGLVGGVLCGVLLYVFSDPIASQLLKKPETAPLLRIWAFLMPIAAVKAVIVSVARALTSFQYIIYQFMVTPTAFVVSILLVSVAGGDVRWLALGYLLSFAVVMVPLALYVVKLIAFLREVPARAVALPFLSFAGIASLMWLFEYIGRNVDILLVGRMCGAADTGVYSIATRNATLCSMIMVSINAFFMPTVSSLYSAGQMDEFRNIFRRGTLWILIVGAPLIVYMMSFSHPIMLFFGKSFGEGAWALWLLALAQLFNQGTGLIATALMMADNQHSVLVANILGILVTVGLCLGLIPIYGANGAAMAMAASVVVTNLTMCAWGYSKLRLSPVSASFFKPVAAAAVAGLISQQVMIRLPMGQLTPQSDRLGQVALVLLVGMLMFAPLYVAGMLALGAKEEALSALKAVRAGSRRRGRVAEQKAEE